MIHHGDSLEVLKTFESNSIDALVTDSPYGLGNTSPANVAACLQAWISGRDYQASGSGFMGKEWDSWVPSPNLWKEVYRVLKPGGHGLVFSGSRTEDLMSISLRLAGFEVRDRLVWLYGSGFPKSHNVSKAIDKKLGGVRKVIGKSKRHGGGNSEIFQGDYNNPITEPATEQAKKYNGFGTALKPAYEPIILVRKPLDGTVADNVLKHGVGGLNIDDCRVGNMGGTKKVNVLESQESKTVNAYGNGLNGGTVHLIKKGRWPANILLDESINDPLLKRYFYCAKASKAEREAGLISNNSRANVHPTVKPLDLMRYLCRLITPPNGTILEPFAGSGTTLCAAALEGFEPIGIEREAEYIEIIKARLKHWSGGKHDYTDKVKAKPLSGEQLSLLNLFKQCPCRGILKHLNRSANKS